ncbi:MAG: GSCFA domain-containing protein [Bacteroidota bacterium]
MTPFRTPIPTPSFPFQLRHRDQLLSIGSCFAENIGSRLATSKFAICQNPFGILYNPMSILRGLQLIQAGYSFAENDLFLSRGLWHSFQHHSQFSNTDPKQVLTQLQSSLDAAHKTLQKCRCLFLTFGTAYVYQHIESDEIVANCHKLPASQFRKYRLATSEIVASYRALLVALNTTFPNLQIILTISPVRHIKDGILENQRSKATLLLAADTLCEIFDFVHYFPSYEYLMDDLRDYRFYAEDMLHPSKVAVDYIWRQFQQSFFSATTLQLQKKIEKISKSAAHRPFQVGSEAHQTFLRNLLTRIEILTREHPYLNFKQEKDGIYRQLSSNN